MSTARSVETRSVRRKRRVRQALIEAGYELMTKKGVDASTMSEISELADVGAGTVYNYFSSKDQLAMCVMEQVMDQLSQRIEAVTNSFEDPAQVYAFGVRNATKAAATDPRWRWLLRRSEVIADAMYGSRVPMPSETFEMPSRRGASTWKIPPWPGGWPRMPLWVSAWPSATRVCPSTRSTRQS